MANNSHTYCDSDDELYIGRVTDKEMLKSALFGQNYDSPVVNCRTPRPKATNHLCSVAQNLPDVLDYSAKQVIAVTEETPRDDKKSKLPATSNQVTALNLPCTDDSVILIDSESQDEESVQILSDDESFLLNEELVESLPCRSAVTDENIYDKNEFEAALTNQEIQVGFKPEINKHKNSNLLPDCVTRNDINKETVKSPLIENAEVVSLNESRESKSPVQCIELKKNSSLNEKNIETRTDEKQNSWCVSDHELELTTVSYNVHHDNSNCLPNKNTQDKTIEYGGCQELETNNTIECEKITSSHLFSYQQHEEDCDEGIKNLDNLNPKSIDALIQASIQLEKDHLSSQFQEKSPNNVLTDSVKKSTDKSKWNNVECSLLSEVSDSVLDISHGSSLSSPVLEPKNTEEFCMQENNINSPIYENFSCDKKQLCETLLRDPHRTLENPAMKDDDLHMSIDEIELQQDHFDNTDSSVNTSGPSMYKSCLEASSCNSYYTAHNVGSGLSLSHFSESFNKYREPAHEAVLLEDTEKVCLLESNLNNKNETNFEVIMQKRQNSFTVVPVTAEVVSDIGPNKPKAVSKLPVYQSSTNVLKPSKFHLKEETMKTNNYKWAKNFPKTEVDNSELTTPSIPKTKIPSTCLVKNPKKQEMCTSKTESKTPVGSHSTDENLLNQQARIMRSEMKTPKPGKHVAKSISSGEKVVQKKPGMLQVKMKNHTDTKKPSLNCVNISTRLVKSEMKSTKTIPAKVSNTCSSEKKRELINSPMALRQEKDRYKNVISPIHAYITGTPIVLQKKAQVINNEFHVLSGSNKTKISHLPLRMQTPLKIPKAVQKLEFQNFQGQENVDPNNLRDTLPPRTIQSAAAVFLKEPEPPKRHLPKIGDRLQKLIDTPRPKITIHQGRVNESPRARGILIPNSSVKSPQQDSGSGRISVRVVRPAEKNN